MRRRDFLGLAAAAGVGVATAGCADIPADAEPVIATNSPRHSPPPARTTASKPAPAPVRGNQLGVVPVLMHHRVVPDATGEYDMTPAFFRAELERLHREKYFPIRTIDLVRRNLSAVPAGRTPVVLTFDDGSPSQFAIDSAARVAPDCAVGIMLDFHAEHPDFPAVASFYVNRNPFGCTGRDADRALATLHTLGCEIGNHTMDHPNLRTLSDAQVRAQIGDLAGFVGRVVPRPRTFALPLGVRPRNRSTLVTGGSGSSRYRNEGVLLVGANPCPSPYHRDFDPMAIPRIRCSSRDGGTGQLELDHWLDRLARPGVRYVAASDRAGVGGGSGRPSAG
ncbi:twin-arginine translocation signal domain-containing protein [Kribbella turkmenica]|uniref:Twin-arginine translocation signal domain-containing protein n=1 Tax=Kribbella turkmenica TaxID=2530375 RepID=A0A4R4WWZ5_9ACTN|nr:polysaccharide deacetylase family protein [Kribbella turkmenica]TDD22296.1 twin-arginine translocation signal domain-containing protein [Kribbella turkmenica]